MIGEDPLFRLTLTLSWTYIRAGDYEQAVKYADKAAAKTKGIDKNSYVFALSLVADAYEAIGAQDKAMACFEETVSLALVMLAKVPDDFFTYVALCTSYAGIGRIYMKNGDIENAAIFLGGVHDMTGRTMAIETPNEAARLELKRVHTLSCKYICELFIKQGKGGEATPFVAEFYALMTELHQVWPDDEDITMKLMLANIYQGDVMRLTHSLKESYPYYLKANQLAGQLAASFERNYEFQTGMIVGLENLGNWHYSNYEFEQALYFYQQQYAKAKELHQKDEDNLYKTLNLLVAAKHMGDVYTGTRQFAEAAMYLKEASQSGIELVNKYPALIECWYNLGVVYESLYRLYATFRQNDLSLYYCRRTCDVFDRLVKTVPGDAHYRETLTFYKNTLNELLHTH